MFSKLLNAVSSGDINTKAFMTTVRNYAKTWSQTGRDCLSRESFVRVESKVHLFWSEMNAKMLDRPQTSFSFQLRFCAAYRSEESYYRNVVNDFEWQWHMVNIQNILVNIYAKLFCERKIVRILDRKKSRSKLSRGSFHTKAFFSICILKLLSMENPNDSIARMLENQLGSWII